MLIITPNVMPKPPSPSVADCSTLITYAGDLVEALENVQSRLNAVSSEPNEAMLLIREHVASMLTAARTMRSNLYSIQSAAKENIMVF